MPQPPRRIAVPRFAPGQRTFYRLATLALVVGVLYWAQVILVPLALAILLAFALTPPAEWLERRRLGRAVSSVVVLAAALGLLGVLGWVAVDQGRSLAADLRKDQDNIAAKFQPVRHLLDEAEHIQSLGEQPAAEPDPAAGPDGPIPVIVKPRGVGVLSRLPTVAAPVGRLAANVLLVAVMTVFLLTQRESFRDRVLALAGRRQLTTTTRALGDAARRVSRYLLLQTGTNAAMGCIVAAGLALIGVPYAALWGLLTAVLRFVPYIGIWLSAAAPFALALAVFPGWTQALLVVALYGVSDLTMMNAVEPLVFGHGTGVSSLALLVAAVFWAFLWGPVGLLLAIPLTVCLVVVGEHVPSLKFLTTLLGDAPQVDPAARYFNRVLARQYDEAAVLVEEQAAGRPLLDVYDEVILPTLAQAKTERDNGDLSTTEERDFYRVTRDVLDGVLVAFRAGTGATDKPARPDTRVVACSAKGEADRLALTMLRDVARQVGCEVEVVPAPRLAAEVQARCGKGEKLVACVAAVSPGGLAQAAGLVRQVRASCPGVRMLVGRWGMTGDTADTERFLTGAGAETVTWTLRETLAEIAPAAATPAEPRPVKTPAEPGQLTVPA